MKLYRLHFALSRVISTAALMSTFLAFRSSFILSIHAFWLSASIPFVLDVAMQHFSWQPVL